MQTHIKAAYDFLENNLPYEYVKQTQRVLKEADIEVSPAVIRHVKNNRRGNNMNVLNALLQVAKNHKKQIKSLKSKLEPIN